MRVGTRMDDHAPFSTLRGVCRGLACVFIFTWVETCSCQLDCSWIASGERGSQKVESCKFRVTEGRGLLVSRAGRRDIADCCVGVRRSRDARRTVLCLE